MSPTVWLEGAQSALDDKERPRVDVRSEGDDDVLEARVKGFRLLGWTQQSIADEVGIDRSSVGRLVKRIERHMLDDNIVSAVRASDLQRIERTIERMWPRLDPDDPDASPDLDAVMAFIALSKRRASLVGADVRPAQTLKIDAPAGMMPGQAAQEAVDELQRMMELADRLAQQGLGSGRVIDAQVNAMDEAC